MRVYSVQKDEVGRHRVINQLFDSFPRRSPSGVKARLRTEYLTGFEESAR